MARINYFGFEYSLFDDKTCRLDSATSAKGRVIIPDYVESNGGKYKVTSFGRIEEAKMREEPSDKRIKDISKYPTENIGGYSPFTCNNRDELDYERALPPNYIVTSVKLPDTVIRLRECAFRRCHALEEVNLPKGITVIPFRAFSGCKALKSIQLHEGITEIGGWAFIGCSAMKEITIPSTVTKIGENAFNDTNQGKSGLEVVNILNDEGAVLMYPNSFTDRVKINYLGKNGAKKIAKDKSAKDTPATKNTSIDIEKLIQAALADGVVTDKERSILIKKVKEAGGDVDEFEMLLDARIFEATKKTAKAETTKVESKPTKTETKAETPKAESKSAAKPATSANGGLTVGSLTGAFKNQFGAVLRIYNGRSKAEDGMSLQEVGLKQEINTTLDGKQTVGAFVEQMANAGLKVKVYTCDEWVAVLDGLTLEQAGKVKKSATKADMEKML